MSTINKKQISEALIKAMQREELHTREAAEKLNLNPCYLSMVQNPNSWDAMSKASCIRLEEWFNTNSPLGLFSIPEGEEIWKAKEKPVKTDAAHVTFKDDKSDIAVAASEKKSKQKDKPPKFNYDFLKDAKFMNYKEVEAEFTDLIAREIGKLEQKLTILPVLQTTDPARQKIAIDIEINLVVNVRKCGYNVKTTNRY
jgi:hypothetical protein